MLDERDRRRLVDIVEHGDRLVDYLADVEVEAYVADDKLRYASERLLEIIGEAAFGLSTEARGEVPADWRRLTGLRNILAHRYGFVDHDLLFVMVERDLPPLLASIRDTLEDDAGRCRLPARRV